MNHADASPVYVPNTPIPATINKLAINLPSVVVGYLSPYPTVVIVVIDHHRASSAVLILEFSLSRSNCKIATEDANSRTMDNNETDMNALSFRLLIKNAVIVFAALNIRKMRKSLMIRAARPHLRRSIEGMDDSRSNMPQPNRYCALFWDLTKVIKKSTRKNMHSATSAHASIVLVSGSVVDVSTIIVITTNDKMLMPSEKRAYVGVVVLCPMVVPVAVVYYEIIIVSL